MENIDDEKNFRFLSDLCEKIEAELSFFTESDGIEAIMSKPEYEISTKLKDTREDACEAIIKMLLTPQVAKTVGIPQASSMDELVFKMEIAGPL